MWVLLRCFIFIRLCVHFGIGISYLFYLVDTSLYTLIGTRENVLDDI